MLHMNYRRKTIVEKVKKARRQTRLMEKSRKERVARGFGGKNGRWWVITHHWEFVWGKRNEGPADVDMTERSSPNKEVRGGEKCSTK